MAKRKPIGGGDESCFRKAKKRGQRTFTVVAQDKSAPATICEWIKLNIETAPSFKLREALDAAIEMRFYKDRKDAD